MLITLPNTGDGVLRMIVFDKEMGVGLRREKPRKINLTCAYFGHVLGGVHVLDMTQREAGRICGKIIQRIAAGLVNPVIVHFNRHEIRIGFMEQYIERDFAIEWHKLKIVICDTRTECPLLYTLLRRG